MATTTVEARTYGGWRVKRGLGMFGMTAIETGLLFIGACFVIVSIGWWQASLWVTAPILILVILSLIRFEGLAMWTLAHRELALLWSKARGRTRYVSPIVHGEHARIGRLPGPLASTTTYEIRPQVLPSHADYGVVYNHATKHATVTYQVHAQSPYLVDTEQLDLYVAGWQGTLSALSGMDQVAHAIVTVRTSTDSSSAEAARLRDRIQDEAPELAKTLVTDLADRERQGTRHVDTTVAVTFDTNYGPAGRSRDIVARLEGVHGLVNGIKHNIGHAGVGAVRALTSRELAGYLRGAFQPSVRADVRAALDGDDPLQWLDQGPTFAESHRRYYEHDQAVTQGWVLRAAPRSHITATVLMPLLRAGTYPRQVSLIWRPLPAHQAVAMLEQERTFANARRILMGRAKMDETARNEVDRSVTDQTAREEAMGASVGDFTLVVTQTLEVAPGISPDELESVLRAGEHEVMNASQDAKLALRPLTGAHDLGLFTSIGAGIEPSAAALRKFLS